jgi:hypothetical protein
MWGLLFATILAGLVVVGQQVEQKFFFYWPTETTQCQVRHFLFTRAELIVDHRFDMGERYTSFHCLYHVCPHILVLS